MNTWCISVGKIAIFADPITLFNRDVAFAGPEHFAELSATTGVSPDGFVPFICPLGTWKRISNQKRRTR
jgi:hypothetical protein